MAIQVEQVAAPDLLRWTHATTTCSIQGDVIWGTGGLRKLRGGGEGAEAAGRGGLEVKGRDDFQNLVSRRIHGSPRESTRVRLSREMTQAFEQIPPPPFAKICQRGGEGGFGLVDGVSEQH
jgi:hypothetical protein